MMIIIIKIKLILGSNIIIIRIIIVWTIAYRVKMEDYGGV